MSLEITPDQKSILDAVDADLETAFLEGVTQAGAYLPALPMYDRIPADKRAQGRKGILATFAGLVKQFMSAKPTLIPLTLVNGFFAWPDPAFQAPSYYVDLTGKVNLTGMVTSVVATTTLTSFASLPVGSRPPKNLIFPGSISNNFTTIYVYSNGNVACHAPTTGVEFISLDGISFTPA